jgi:hypothetical protein
MMLARAAGATYGRRPPRPMWSPTVHQRRRSVDPRIVASIAIILALGAIALEIVYAVGRFAITTVEQFPS